MNINTNRDNNLFNPQEDLDKIKLPNHSENFPEDLMLLVKNDVEFSVFSKFLTGNKEDLAKEDVNLWIQSVSEPINLKNQVVNYSTLCVGKITSLVAFLLKLDPVRPDQYFSSFFIKDALGMSLIETYSVTNENVKIQIAKSVAIKKAATITRNIHNYAIKDQKALIEIAKLTAQKKGWETSICIKNYGIKDQKALIEIAKLAAQQDGWGTSEHIKNYGIEDLNALIEIAKIVAQKPDSGASEHIKNYGIKDQKALIDIAKLAAQQDKSGVSPYIKNYSIKEPNALIEIAKLAAHHDGGEASEYIKEYGIKDQKALIEIATLAAQQNGLGASKYIKNYGIKDQNALIEIAKLAAQQNGCGTSQYIKNYGIEDKNALIKIAKLAAQQNGLGASKYIKNYGIQDKKSLIEIAQLAAKQDGWGTSERIQNYGITNPIELLGIFLEAFKNNAKSLIFIGNYSLSLSEEVLNKLTKMSKAKEICENFIPVSKDLKVSSLFKKIEGTIINLANNPKIPQEQLQSIEDHLFNWLTYTVIMSLIKKVPENFNEEIWQEIIDYRDPHMRYAFTDLIYNMSDMQYKVSQNFCAKKPNYTILPSLFMGHFVKNELDWKDLNEILTCRDLLKDKFNKRVLIETQYTLSKSLELDESDIIEVLRAALVFNTNKSIRITETEVNLRAVQGIIGCGGAKEFKKEVFLQNRSDISLIFTKQFKKIIPVQEIAEFSTKFDRTFGKCRSSSSLLVYASRMKQLLESEKKKASEALSTYVEWVLEGSFTTKRYTDSTHLNNIFLGRNDLKEKWIEGAKEDLTSISKKISKEDLISISQKISPTDYKPIFYQKIITDKHLKECLYISGYLKEIPTVDLKPTDVEQAIINIIENKEIEKEKVLLFTLRDFLEKTDPQCELMNDITSMIASFKKINSGNLTLIDTDDFWDLFMCGTEVGGSCQRVDGDSRLNKCLLGYVLDGKNRMIAIKNNEGVIVARSILRLLWDSEHKRPALFMERIYPNDKYQKEMIDFAKKRAQILKLDLYQSGKSLIKLESMSSNAPWEYVDASGGVHINGVYVITNANKIE